MSARKLTRKSHRPLSLPPRPLGPGAEQTVGARQQHDDDRKLVLRGRGVEANPRRGQVFGRDLVI